MLSLLGLAIVGFDIVPSRLLQGFQSSCTHNTLSSKTLGVHTLAAFDILTTSLVTNRMMQAIRGCGGFRKVARQNLSEYGLYSPILSNFRVVFYHDRAFSARFA
ncbi:hypothetical protein C8R41DRAFT_859925 [Lentinula lateritia]|uniref:Uncharacterized protein n=1 Tax=Lentinula lateritia TaxID=40482 RepID=A0ABQ8UYW4_9AGAR|nr:hypothetical protein C8R41DRAFT_859925 [Lentinula lateritia]